MDLLYRAYSSPMDLMSRYINSGRFGEFVYEFLKAEFERRKAEAEKDNNLLLWIAYVHSYSEDSFNDWKERVCKPASTTRSRKKDADLTDKGVEQIINKFFPS